MRSSELIKLPEAAGVDDALQRAVEVVADRAFVVEDEAFAVFGGVGLPFGEAVHVGVA